MSRQAAEPTHGILEVRDLTRSINGTVIHSRISLKVASSDILFVRGPSGVGKSLLLRSIAFLDPFDEGTLTLNGRTPAEWGIPRWRSLVTYVHQSRVGHSGTPAELYFAAQNFAAQRGRPRGDLPAIVAELGLEPSILNQPWAQLSGGQAQRVQLAIAVALKPLVLLVDEPTSALDPDSARRAERVLKSCGSALVWVSHDPQQPARVGGRVLTLPLGTESAITAGPPSPVPSDVSASPDKAGQAERASSLEEQ